MKHVTISDIAKHANVGRATVDRVLNGRKSTKPETIQKVLHSAQTLGYRVTQSNILNNEKLITSPQNINSCKLGFILPSDKYSFYKSFSKSLMNTAQNNAITAPKFVFFTLEDIEQIATAIINLAKEVDIIGIISIDHPLIRYTVNEVTLQGIKVITLISDLSPCNQAAYIGLDNKKAGRTAAWAVQHFFPDSKKIGIIIGDNRFLCQETCEISFRSYLRENKIAHHILEPVQGYENIQDGYDTTIVLLEQHPDLSLIYAPCGGIEGIAQALIDTKRNQNITFICHGPIINQQLRFIDGTIDLMLTNQINTLSSEVINVSKQLFKTKKSGFIKSLIDFTIKTKENF